MTYALDIDINGDKATLCFSSRVEAEKFVPGTWMVKPLGDGRSWLVSDAFATAEKSAPAPDPFDLYYFL